MKNILSYKLGTIFTGKEIKDWIKYHTERNTSKTRVAKRMTKFLNLDDNEKYYLYKDTYSSCGSYNHYLVQHVSKEHFYHEKNN